MKNLFQYVFILTVSAVASIKVVGYSYSTPPNSTDINYSMYTHIVGSFVTSDLQGNLLFDSWTSSEDIVAVLNQAKLQGAVPMIAFGTTVDGWNMTKDPVARGNFISNLLSFCDSNGIKGIDLDLEGTAEEFNWGSPGTFFPLPYESLAVELREAMPDSMILTAAVGSTARNGAQWTDRFLGAMDWINVMIYDRALSWEESPIENHSTWEAHASSAEYWHLNRGLSKDRICLGLPFYARGWDLTNNRMYRENPGWNVSTWDYKYFANRYNIKIDQDTLDFPATDSIQFKRAEGVTGSGTLFFNSPELIARKTAWTIDNSYGGVMVWHIDGDLPTADSLSLLASLNKQMNKTTGIITEVKKSSTNLDVIVQNNSIQFENNSEFHSVELYSVLGYQLLSQNISGKKGLIEISSSDLSTGNYILKLRGEVDFLKEFIIR